MKKYFSLFLFPLFLALAGCGGSAGPGEGEEGNDNTASDTQLTVKGSDTQLLMTQKLAKAYGDKHPGTNISVSGGGSGVGISALFSGTTDLAMASRDLKTDEKLKLAADKKEVKEVIVAYDALAVIVHPSNSVGQLTRQQLEDIFTGKITNWKEVGGADKPIVVYSRESSSGTYEFFKEHVMDKKNYRKDVLAVSSTGHIIQSVSQTEGAIGYVGLGYVKPDAGVKTVAVSYDEGKTYTQPSVEAAMNKTYPISRPLYYFYPATASDKVGSFIEFALSDEGQQVVAQEGFIPVEKGK